MAGTKHRAREPVRYPRFGLVMLRYDDQGVGAPFTAEGTFVVPPKKREPKPENTHANGPNMDVLRADPEVVIRSRPPDPIPRFVPDIWLIEPIDDLELIGRRPRDEDEADE